MALGHITTDDLPYLNSEELYLLQSRPMVPTSTSPPSNIGGSYSNQESFIANDLNDDQAGQAQNQALAMQQNQALAMQQTSQNMPSWNWGKIDWFWVAIGLSLAGLLVALGMRKKEKNNVIDSERTEPR